jgi:hypothetical protein
VLKQWQSIAFFFPKKRSVDESIDYATQTIKHEDFCSSEAVLISRVVQDLLYFIFEPFHFRSALLGCEKTERLICNQPKSAESTRVFGTAKVLLQMKFFIESF